MSNDKPILITDNFIHSHKVNQFSQICIFKHSPVLVTKTKTCKESVEFGKVNSKGYLNQSDYERLVQFMKSFTTNERFIVSGDIATYAFTGTPLSKAAGRIFNHQGKNVFAILNPDKIKYNKYQSAAFPGQINNAIQFLKGKIDQKKCNIYITTESEFIKKFQSHTNTLSIDIETANQSQITMISFTFSNMDGELETYVIDNPTKRICPILEKRKLILQNGVYDLFYLNKLLGLNYSKLDEISDTMMNHRILFPSSKSSLDELTKTYAPGWPSWKNYT